MKKLKVALIGHGLSGKTFHAPFLSQMPEFEFKTIVTSQLEVMRLYPGIVQYHRVEDILSLDLDLVVITSPNQFHFAQAKMLLEAGKHIVLEKPFVNTLSEAKELFAISEKTGKQLFVYQNRRYDGDFVTIKKMINEGKLGQVHYFESHFDRYRKVPKENWRNEPGPGSGVLFDLGPHLLDQAIALFGIPKSYHVKKRFHGDAKVDSGFYIFMEYENCEVHLQAHTLACKNDLRFVVHGTEGSFVKYGLDGQEAELKEGKKIQKIGHDLEENYGSYYTPEQTKKITTARGNYQLFYQDVYQALTANIEFPIKKEQLLKSLEIMTSASQE